MKKLLVLFAALTFGCCAMAQDSKMKDKKMNTGMEHKMSGKMNDMVMMKGDKMMMRKEGKWVAMDQEMTMKNGTKVMTDGTVMNSDGTKMKMMSGDRMTMEGKMMHARKPMGEKMPMEKSDKK